MTLTSHTESYRVRLGELVVEGDRVIEYREKPEKRHLICSGIAVIEPPIVELVWRDRPMGISDLHLREALAGWTRGRSLDTPLALDRRQLSRTTCRRPTSNAAR